MAARHIDCLAIGEARRVFSLRPWPMPMLMWGVLDHIRNWRRRPRARRSVSGLTEPRSSLREISGSSERTSGLYCVGASGLTTCRRGSPN
jgi:hypothetical protein